MTQGAGLRPKDELHVIRPLRKTADMTTDTWRISTPEGDHIADVPWDVARLFWLGKLKDVKGKAGEGSHNE